MDRAIDFLEDLKAHFGVTSDYALAKCMGWSHTRMSNYRCGRSSFDVDTAYRVAELLEKNPAYVLACIERGRATGKEAKQRWADRARRLAGAFVVNMALLACILHTALLPTISEESEPSAASQFDTGYPLYAYRPVGSGEAGALWALCLLAMLTHALRRRNDLTRSW